jgi:hypothetical protein
VQELKVRRLLSEAAIDVAVTHAPDARHIAALFEYLHQPPDEAKIGDQPPLLVVPVDPLRYYRDRPLDPGNGVELVPAVVSLDVLVLQLRLQQA